MRDRAGYAELVTCGLIWGSIGVLVKRSPVAAPVIVFFRLALGAAVVGAWVAWRGRLSDLRIRRHRPLVVGSGLMLAAHWVFFFLAYKRLSVATTILVVYIGPVFMALLAPAVLGERLERKTIGSLVLSLAGIALIAGPATRGGDAFGFAAAVLAMATFVALVLMVKKMVAYHDTPILLTWQLGVAALAVSPFLAFDARLSAIAESWPTLLALGVVHTGLAGVLYFQAMKVVKAQHVSILVYLEPVTAVLWAWFVLSERPGIATLAGGALIVAAGLNIAAPGRVVSPEMPEAATAEVRP